MTEEEKQKRFKKIFLHLVEVSKLVKIFSDLNPVVKFNFDPLIGLYFRDLKKKYAQICISVNDPESNSDILIGFYTKKQLETVLTSNKIKFENHSLTFDLAKDTELIKSIILPYI